MNNCNHSFLKIVAIAAIVIFSAAAAAVASTADTLFMKDNSVRLGKIISRDSSYTSIQTETDLLVIANDEIARVGHARPSELLLPRYSFYLNGGLAVPSQFNFPSDVGIRVGARYMISKMLGAGLSVTYASWQTSYDTVVSNVFKGNNAPVTETFSVTAVSPRVNLFLATPLAASAQLLIGVDLGETIFSINSPDTTANPQTNFSFAFRFDIRFAITEHIAFLIGAQFESFSTTFVDLENHQVTQGANRRLGDMLISAGADVGL